MKNPLPIVVSILVAIVSYGAVISFLAQSSVQAATSTIRMYVTPSTSGTTVGQTSAVQLRLYKNSPAKVDYADARVTFSATHLEVVTISRQGSHFSLSGSPAVSFNNSTGSLTVAGWGNELADTADVLIATITFRGKAPGSGGVSISASSGAGDMTNGGHLKNSLDSRVGGVINIANPIGGTTTPPPPSTPVPTSQQSTPDGQDSSVRNDAQAVEQTGTYSDVDASTERGVASDIEKTVARPPIWLQFLLPAAGVVGVTGLAGLGYVLHRKRNADGVTLPPASEEPLGSMPSTEDIGAMEARQTESALTPEPSAGQYDIGSADLPEFSAQRTLDYTAPLTAASDPAVLDAVSDSPVAPVVTQSTEATMGVPSVVGVVQPETIPQEVISAPADQAVSPDSSELQPEDDLLPVQLVLPPQSETPMTPMGDATPAPVAAQPAMPSTMTQPQPAGARVAEEYADLPDMFDIGEQRLRDEGHGELTPARP